MGSYPQGGRPRLCPSYLRVLPSPQSSYPYLPASSSEISCIIVFLTSLLNSAPIFNRIVFSASSRSSFTDVIENSFGYSTEPSKSLPSHLANICQSLVSPSSKFPAFLESVELVWLKSHAFDTPDCWIADCPSEACADPPSSLAN